VLVLVAVVTVAGGRSDADDDAPVPAAPPRPTDDFNRPDALELSSTADGTPWEVVSGRWGIVRGQATLIDGEEQAVAVLDVGDDDVELTAFLARPLVGAGLVFRWQGPEDHWQLLPSTTSGTWVVRQITNGAVVNEAAVDSGSDRFDSSTAHIRLDGADVEVQVDVGPPVTLRDARPAGSRVGLLALDGPVGSRWDDLDVRRA
jgi:hypothetical protein